MLLGLAVYHHVRFAGIISSERSHCDLLFPPPYSSQNSFFSIRSCSRMANVIAFACLLVVAMDVLAGVLAIEAEAAKNKAQKSSKSLACKELRNHSFELALAATVLLALAHVSSNLLGGCICICSVDEIEQSSSNRQLWFACLVSSWIVAAVGFPMLVFGMLENLKLQGSCRFLHPHFLLIGGGLCFVHGLLCIILYVSSVVSFKRDKAGGREARPR
ncbi:uncharacterized protein LOC104448357 isoform X2 [Eucalyptus grandis]|nr:uncharacterized protein LOC104448357 isoform X2 [Eucalyptus grandis]